MASTSLKDLAMFQTLSQANEQPESYDEPPGGLAAWQRLPMTRDTGIYRTAIADEDSRAYAQHQAEMQSRGIDLDQFREDRKRWSVLDKDRRNARMTKTYGDDWNDRLGALADKGDTLRESSRGSFGGGFSNIGSRPVMRQQPAGGIGALLDGAAQPTTKKAPAGKDGTLARQTNRGKAIVDIMKVLTDNAEVSGVQMNRDELVKAAGAMVDRIIPGYQPQPAQPQQPQKSKVRGRLPSILGNDPDNEKYAKAGAYRFWDKNQHAQQRQKVNQEYAQEYIAKAQKAGMKKEKWAELYQLAHPDIQAELDRILGDSIWGEEKPKKAEKKKVKKQKPETKTAKRDTKKNRTVRDVNPLAVNPTIDLRRGLGPLDPNNTPTEAMMGNPQPLHEAMRGLPRNKTMDDQAMWLFNRLRGKTIQQDPENSTDLW